MCKYVKTLLFLAAAASVIMFASPILAKTYVIQKGDTLFSIAKMFGVTVNELAEQNKLENPDKIYPGRQLWIPEGLVYTVKVGDTLFSIARKHGLPYQELMSKNGLSTSFIYPGQKLYITGGRNKYPTGPGALQSRYVLGFYVEKEKYHPGSYDRLKASGSQLSAVAPFWYRLSPSDGAALEEHFTAEKNLDPAKREVITRAHQDNVQVFALVHNMLYSPGVDSRKLASDLLATVESRSKFISRLENLVREYGYDGVNLDIEMVNLKDRDRFSLLVKELYQRFAPQGYKVSVCVPAKVREDLANNWSGPFDYQAVARYADYVVLMTYDEHGYSSRPGPIASYGWVRDVVKYAVDQIPPEKILLGVPGYGFDWREGETGPTYLSFSQATEIAASRGVRISWDNAGKVPFYRYRDYSGKNHQVWFENASSLTYKLDIVDRYTLRGIAVWRLGMEDPEIWRVLQSKLKAEKS